MRAAAPAADLDAVHAVAVVVHELHAGRHHRFGEARPAGARLELGVGAEQLGAAGGAAVHPVVLDVDVLAAERRLGPRLPLSDLVISAIAIPLITSSTNLGHAASGLDEVGFVDPVAPLLARHRVQVAAGDRLVAGAGTQDGAQVVFGGREQAGADLAVRREPHPV